MPKLFYRIFPFLLCWGIVGFVVLQVPYPDSLAQSTPIQFSSFFIPLFFAISFTINLFLKNILSSSVISLGVIFLLILKALGSLNIVSGALITVAVGLLVSYFQKITTRNLTNKSKIPKLTQLRKQ